MLNGNEAAVRKDCSGVAWRADQSKAFRADPLATRDEGEIRMGSTSTHSSMGGAHEYLPTHLVPVQYNKSVFVVISVARHRPCQWDVPAAMRTRTDDSGV